MLKWIKQTIAVTLLSIRTIPQRASSSVVAIVGIAGVVIVFVAVLSIREGVRAAVAAGRSPRRPGVVRSGAGPEVTGGGDAAKAHPLQPAPGPLIAQNTGV